MCGPPKSTEKLPEPQHPSPSHIPAQTTAVEEERQLIVNLVPLTLPLSLAGVLGEPPVAEPNKFGTLVVKYVWPDVEMMIKDVEITTCVTSQSNERHRPTASPIVSSLSVTPCTLHILVEAPSIQLHLVCPVPVAQ